MSSIISLSKRNLLMFFRNKSEVFFSFLSVIIILGLYILFLSDIQVLNIKNVVGDVPGLAALVNSWVMAGLLAVSTFTISLGALGRMVADREKKALDEFLVAPIKRHYIFISYIISTLIINFIISLVLLILSELYIISTGGELLSVNAILYTLFILTLCVLSSSLLLLFIVSFVKSEQTLSVIASVIGTMIGFITGAYIPIGIMPKFLQIFSNIIPVSQGASLFRKIFLETPVNEVFKNAPIEALSEYYKMQGVNLYVGNYELSSNFMILYIIGSIILFSIINIIRFKKMKI